MARLEDAWPKKSLPNGHPMDGTTLEIPMGDGAWMSIPDPRARGGIFSSVPPIGWHLTWGSADKARFAAAALINSYTYLLSGEINETEARRRLKLMRAAWKTAAHTGAPAHD